jgi:hypothetical protein
MSNRPGRIRVWIIVPSAQLVERDRWSRDSIVGCWLLHDWILGTSTKVRSIATFSTTTLKTTIQTLWQDHYLRSESRQSQQIIQSTYIVTMKLNTMISTSALVLMLSVSSFCHAESKINHHASGEADSMMRLGWDTIGHLLNEQIDSTHTAHEDLPVWEIWLGCGVAMLGCMLLVIPSAMQLRLASGNKHTVASSYEPHQANQQASSHQQYEYDLSYSERSYFSQSENATSSSRGVRRRSFPRSFGVWIFSHSFMLRCYQCNHYYRDHNYLRTFLTIIDTDISF